MTAFPGEPLLWSTARSMIRRSPMPAGGANSEGAETAGRTTEERAVIAHGQFLRGGAGAIGGGFSKDSGTCS
jgi:hypothetical protein